jgi:coenzyme F420-reducing hydrogenase beta subunit
LEDFILNEIDKLFDLVINNGYCIGCGNCASVDNSPLVMNKNDEGKYIPELENKSDNYDNIEVLSVCPFMNNEYNEDIIGDKLYKDIINIKHSKYTGYYLNNYAGYVKNNEYRMNGSSGGMGTWLAAKLLEENLVDGIIHVKEVDNSDKLFSYQISRNINELKKGSKSKYYPIESSEMIEYIKNNPGEYALVGIPCFIKAIRMLSLENEIINQRIKFTIGLVCGHLKSDYFAKSIAWELGIKPDQINNIDFRIKYEDKPANRYGLEVEGLINDEKVKREAVSSSLYVTNWGHGLFKYKACDYCDDVLAENADITIGDAWLPEYVKDNQGTNIITIRNHMIDEIINNYRNEIYLEELSVDKIFSSQAGGFRHRREALAYRLYLKDQKNKWYPDKRVEPGDKNISKKRKEIYNKRIELFEESFKAYKKALEKDDFNIFKKHMKPLLRNYNKLIKKPLINRVFSKLKRIILN